MVRIKTLCQEVTAFPFSGEELSVTWRPFYVYREAFQEAAQLLSLLFSLVFLLPLLFLSVRPTWLTSAFATDASSYIPQLPSLSDVWRNIQTRVHVCGQRGMYVDVPAPVPTTK